MFKRRGNHRIYILSGVEDYLTESAKKHKRNLMFLAFFVGTLTATSLLYGDIVFKSAFGFSIDYKNGEGINASTFLAFASVACIYEIFMLSIYKKQCDSHYFGKQLNRTNSVGSSEQLDNFKRVVELIDYDIHDSSELNSLLEKHLKRSHLLIDTLEKQLPPDEVKDSLSRLFDTYENLHHKAIATDAEYAGNAIFQRVEYLSSDSNRSLNAGQIQEIERIISSQVMQRMPRPLNSQMFQQIHDLVNDYQKIFDLSKESVLNNEDWKTYIEHQLQANLNRYEELNDLIKSQGSASRSIVFAEVYFPIAFGLLSVAVCFKWVLFPYLSS